ncbi:hypothetical protein [Megasphaera vaginalis (ex Srinivasan et al. 2021)]|uniref:Uncharacterized protein n=1 Tax=Megasphaera vaginalis (ex Srinivasan et al. 2021) TaxID=1111454 RepID=U7UPE1_9FIRM|nr:hypothetical protein [Megasphaera vaginalis (ex Srinivasan et al. 2021)]ERT60769.1 hypothetical protein HMPREF1250_0273 [Megasphaera vaginalis (ex Srinivasan et al. 2021)]
MDKITDKQGTQWVLQKLYDNGFRYLAMDKNENIYAFENEPHLLINEWIGENRVRIPFDFTVLFASELDVCEPLDIGKELGVIDWEKVPVDTRVLFSKNGGYWAEGHFARYDKNRNMYAVFNNGKTSWTTGNDDIGYYRLCKLVEKGTE